MVFSDDELTGPMKQLCLRIARYDPSLKVAKRRQSTSIWLLCPAFSYISLLFQLCFSTFLQLNVEALYQREGGAPAGFITPGESDAAAAASAGGAALQAGIVWTPGMRRMYTLLERCARPSDA